MTDSTLLSFKDDFSNKIAIKPFGKITFISIHIFKINEIKL